MTGVSSFYDFELAVRGTTDPPTCSPHNHSVCHHLRLRLPYLVSSLRPDRTAIYLMFALLGIRSGTAAEIGSVSRMYDLLVLAAADTPVVGNEAGSYLTMKSNQGMVFGAATILSGFAGVFCDQGASVILVSKDRYPN